MSIHNTIELLLLPPLLESTTILYQSEFAIGVEMRIKPLPLNNYSWISRVIFWAQKKKYGQTLFPAKVWGQVPPLFYGLQFFYRCLDRKNSPIKPKLKLLINIRISQINHCSFCSDIGEALLHRHSIPTEKIESISNYQNNALFSTQEQIALSYADAITFTDQNVNPELFQRLQTIFSNEEIIELTALICYQNFSSKFNAALDIPPQGFCLYKKNM